MDPRLAERNIVEYLYNALGGPSLLLGRSTVKVTNIFSHFLTLGVSADDLPELQHKLRRVAHVSSRIAHPARQAGPRPLYAVRGQNATPDGHVFSRGSTPRAARAPLCLALAARKAAHSTGSHHFHPGGASNTEPKPGTARELRAARSTLAGGARTAFTGRYRLATASQPLRRTEPPGRETARACSICVARPYHRPTALTLL